MCHGPYPPTLALDLPGTDSFALDSSAKGHKRPPFPFLWAEGRPGQLHAEVQLWEAEEAAVDPHHTPARTNGAVFFLPFGWRL
jgi:hypothetical protein